MGDVRVACAAVGMAIVQAISNANTSRLPIVRLVCVMMCTIKVLHKCIGMFGDS